MCCQVWQCASAAQGDSGSEANQGQPHSDSDLNNGAGEWLGGGGAEVPPNQQGNKCNVNVKSTNHLGLLGLPASNHAQQRLRGEGTDPHMFYLDHMLNDMTKFSLYDTVSHRINN